MVTLTMVWAVAVLALSFILCLFFLGKWYYEWREIPILAFPFAFILINNIIGLFQGLHNFKTYNTILIIVNLLLIFFLLVILNSIGYIGNIWTADNCLFIFDCSASVITFGIFLVPIAG